MLQYSQLRSGTTGPIRVNYPIRRPLGSLFSLGGVQPSMTSRAAGTCQVLHQGRNSGLRAISRPNCQRRHFLRAASAASRYQMKSSRRQSLSSASAIRDDRSLQVLGVCGKRAKSIPVLSHIPPDLLSYSRQRKDFPAACVSESPKASSRPLRVPDSPQISLICASGKSDREAANARRTAAMRASAEPALITQCEPDVRPPRRRPSATGRALTQRGKSPACSAGHFNSGLTRPDSSSGPGRPDGHRDRRGRRGAPTTRPGPATQPGPGLRRLPLAFVGIRADLEQAAVASSKHDGAWRFAAENPLRHQAGMPAVAAAPGVRPWARALAATAGRPCPQPGCLPARLLPPGWPRES